MKERHVVAISVLEKYTSIIIQLAGTMIIARLLTPAEFGVFSLAMSVAILAQVFRDLGVGQYIIQEKNLTEDKIRASQSIFWISSLLLGTALISSGPIASSFFNQHDLSKLLLMLGINFYLIPIGALTLSLWKRNLDFFIVAITGVMSTLVNTTTTIILALQGFSYFSLVWGVLAGTITTALMCVFFGGPEGKILPGVRKLSIVVKYSLYATFNSLLQSLSERSPSLVLGKTEGMAATGIFERALGVAEIFDRIFMQAIWAISTPIIAKRVRESSEVEKNYIKAVSIITASGFAFMAWLIISAENVIFILYGDQWGAAVIITQLICIKIAINMPNYLSSSLIVAHGDIKRQTVVTVISRGSAIIAVVIGSQGGIEGVAYGLIASSVISNAFIYYMIQKYVSAKKVILTTLKSAIPACIASVSMIYLLQHSSNDSVVFWLSSSVLAGAIWIACLTFMKHPLYNEVMFTLRNKKVLT